MQNYPAENDISHVLPNGASLFSIGGIKNAMAARWQAGRIFCCGNRQLLVGGGVKKMPQKWVGNRVRMPENVLKAGRRVWYVL